MLGTVLTAALRDQAVDDAESSLAQYTDAVVGPHLVEGGEIVVDEQAAAVIAGDLERRPNIVNVKVWDADGTLAWTRLAPERIGNTYPLGGGLAKAIETGEPDGHLEDLPEEEDTAEALGITKLLEVYAPIRSDGEVVGRTRSTPTPRRSRPRSPTGAARSGSRRPRSSHSSGSRSSSSSATRRRR